MSKAVHKTLATERDSAGASAKASLVSQLRGVERGAWAKIENPSGWTYEMNIGLLMHRAADLIAKAVVVEHEYRAGEYCDDIGCDRYSGGAFHSSCDECPMYTYYKWLVGAGYRLLKTSAAEIAEDDQ